MEKVKIESPCIVDINLHGMGVSMRKTYAKYCIKDSIERGEIPFSTQLFYSQVLECCDKQHRFSDSHDSMIFSMVDKVAVYEDLGITEDMKKLIIRAEEFGKPIEYRKLKEQEFKRFFQIRVDMKSLWEEICRVNGLEGVRPDTKIRAMAYAKHSFAAIAIEFFPKTTLEQIGAYLGKDHSTVSYYLKEIIRVKEKAIYYQRVRQKLLL